MDFCERSGPRECGTAGIGHLMAADPAFRRSFQKSLEQKIAHAQAQNPGVLVSWELSKACDHLIIVCDDSPMRETVVRHLADSLTRLLGVGKRMGLVERSVSALIVKTFAQVGNTPLSSHLYPVD